MRWDEPSGSHDSGLGLEVESQGFANYVRDLQMPLLGDALQFQPGLLWDSRLYVSDERFMSHWD
jgi:hypothetical protein